MIARIYGIFTIKTNYYSDVDIIIMENTSNLLNKNNINHSFDLKGSMIGRRVKCKNAESYKKRLLKDTNFLELNDA